MLHTFLPSIVTHLPASNSSGILNVTNLLNTCFSITTLSASVNLCKLIVSTNFYHNFTEKINFTFILQDSTIYFATIASISIRTSFGSLATSTQERAGQSPVKKRE